MTWKRITPSNPWQSTRAPWERFDGSAQVWEQSPLRQTFLDFVLTQLPEAPPDDVVASARLSTSPYTCARGRGIHKGQHSFLGCNVRNFPCLRTSSQSAISELVCACAVACWLGKLPLATARRGPCLLGLHARLASPRASPRPGGPALQAQAVELKPRSPRRRESSPDAATPHSTPHHEMHPALHHISGKVTVAPDASRSRRFPDSFAPSRCHKSVF